MFKKRVKKKNQDHYVSIKKCDHQYKNRNLYQLQNIYKQIKKQTTSNRKDTQDRKNTVNIRQRNIHSNYNKRYYDRIESHHIIMSLNLFRVYSLISKTDFSNWLISKIKLCAVYKRYTLNTAIQRLKTKGLYKTGWNLRMQIVQPDTR